MRLDHPTIKGVSVEVPDKDAAHWRKAGWVVKAPSRGTKPPRSATTRRKSPNPDRETS